MKRPWTYHFYFHVTLAVIASSCIEPFSPVITSTPENILAVDGFINYAEKSAHIKLAHALPLDATTPPPPETNATISIEEENGTTFPLVEEVTSNYAAISLPLDFAKKYRLNIQTQDGRVYQSGFIALHNTPPIDSITWRPDRGGVTVFANTHDDAENQGRYYSWDFTETWQYESPFTSQYKFEKGVIVIRKYFEYNNVCWNTVKSSEVLVSSTRLLTKDVIKDFPLQRLPKGSDKLSIRYSILVKQKKISEEEYNYWQLLKKTTQSVGGLFDPLPARVTGNIVCTSNPSEPVLGYFSGGTIKEQRIFINANEVPNDLRWHSTINQCPLDSMSTDQILDHPGELYIINTFGNPPLPSGYVTTSKECIDCRTKGGVTTKPDFW